MAGILKGRVLRIDTKNISHSDDCRSPEETLLKEEEVVVVRNVYSVSRILFGNHTTRYQNAKKKNF